MVVKCNACDTRFELSDSLIPFEGTHVRCSRCQQTFFLDGPERPASSQSVTESVTALPQEEISDALLGDLSVSFDVAVEADREETSFARKADAPGIEERSGEPVAFSQGDEEGTVVPAAVQSADGIPLGPTIPVDRVDRPNAKAPSRSSKEVSGRPPGPTATARQPRVPRPPQPTRLANLAGWFALALLSAVGLLRGL